MSQLPPKDEVLRALLEEGSVFVHLDPRREGVVVPRRFSAQPQLVLQLGLALPIPIDDLKIDERGWSATLSFQRTPFACEVPWPAVYAIVGEDGRGMVWPDALPAELLAELRREVHGALEVEEEAEGPEAEDAAAAVVSLEAVRRRRPRPKAPGAGRGGARSASDEEDPEPPTRPGRRGRPPWLRVVK